MPLVADTVSALVAAGLLEPMTPERLHACGFDRLGPEPSPAAVFIHAHKARPFETRCTSSPEGVCPHHAMTIDYMFESDMNDDANTFGMLQALLQDAGIPLVVRRRNEDGVFADVSCDGWSASRSVDVHDASVAALVGVLNEGAHQLGVEPRFVHVETRELTTHAIVLRRPHEVAALRRIIPEIER